MRSPHGQQRTGRIDPLPLAVIAWAALGGVGLYLWGSWLLFAVVALGLALQGVALRRLRDTGLPLILAGNGVILFLLLGVWLGLPAWRMRALDRRFQDALPFECHPRRETSPHPWGRLPFEPSVVGKVLVSYDSGRGTGPNPRHRVHPLFLNLPVGVRAEDVKEVQTVIELDPPGTGRIRTRYIHHQWETFHYPIPYDREFPDAEAFTKAVTGLPRQIPPLLAKLPEFRRTPRGGSPDGPPTRRGKFLVLDTTHSKPDEQSFGMIHEVQWFLPSDLAAIRPEEVGTVVWVKKGSEQSGMYTSGSGAFSRFEEFTFIDARQWRVVGTHRLYGSASPGYVSAGESGAGALPTTEDARKFLTSVPVLK